MNIQVAQQEKDKRCKDRILEYALDSVRLTHVSDEFGSDMFQINMARIIVQLSEPLGISEDDGTNLIPEIKKKGDQAKEVLDALGQLPPLKS